MILIDRKKIPAPEALSAFQEKEINEIGARLTASDIEPYEKPLDLFKSRKLRETVHASLNQLFAGNCAFCERPASSIKHFRPRWRASRLDGRIDRGSYWWLAGDWSNLYLCCQSCNAQKANFFPIEGPAASPLTFGDALAAEKPLLVDPCSEDPALHLRFHVNGSVEPITLKGEVTIKVFGLNDASLVRRRLLTAEYTRFVCEREWLMAEGFDDKESFVRTVLSLRQEGSAHEAVVRAVIDDFVKTKSGPVVVPPIAQFLLGPPAGSMPATVDAISSPVWLQRINICNFKSVTVFDRKFPQLVEGTEAEGQPWIMLLGENGAGKTSILQAVALALMPDSERAEHEDLESWQRKDSDDGFIELTFTDNSTRKLSYKQGDKVFAVEGSVPKKMPVLAYGATRLLPERKKNDERVPAAISVQNLFDPRFPLIDAERRLCDHEAIPDESFRLLVEDIKRLLPSNATAPIERNKSGLTSKANGRVIPLRELSNGYKSVLALAMDIMLHLTNSSFDMESAQGLVMIDEIELHLHPRWKFRIVEQLRSLFPRVRFISCTHDPLCVHGLYKGELLIIGHDPATQDLKVEPYDVPLGMRADEILTGPWFGMQGTIDKGSMELMAEHSALLQMENRTEAQERNLEVIGRDLQLRLGFYGDTPDPRLAFANAARQAAQVSALAASDMQVNSAINERFNAILNGDSKKGRDNA